MEQNKSNLLLKRRTVQQNKPCKHWAIRRVYRREKGPSQCHLCCPVSKSICQTRHQAKNTRSKRGSKKISIMQNTDNLPRTCKLIFNGASINNGTVYLNNHSIKSLSSSGKKSMEDGLTFQGDNTITKNPRVTEHLHTTGRVASHNTRPPIFELTL